MSKKKETETDFGKTLLSMTEPQQQPPPCNATQEEKKSRIALDSLHMLEGLNKRCGTVIPNIT